MSQINQSTLAISWKAIQHNLAYFKAKLKKETHLMLMVKASAYGNGAIQLAKKLEAKHSCDYLSVAYLNEGIELRNAGVELPIMVLNPSLNSWEMMVKHCLEPEIHNLISLQSFIHYLTKSEVLNKGGYPIHLKFNTGMNRLGLEASEIQDVISIIAENKSVKINSVMTHLSCSGTLEEDEYTKRQFTLFEQIKSDLQPHLPAKTLFHVLNSNAIEHFPEFQYDMVRLGIGLYGASSLSELKSSLVPICKFKSQVSAIRKVKKGDSISYSRSGKAPDDGFVATLGLGYADGFNRNLGNGNWQVEINGKLYPTIGNICMDLSMVFLGDDQPEIGLEVIIFGGKKSIHEYAKAQKTITYEALTNIGSRVSKLLVD